MSKTRQFDRSKCFTFFNTYRTQGKRIREKYGDKMAADYYEAIIDYRGYAESRNSKRKRNTSQTGSYHE